MKKRRGLIMTISLVVSCMTTAVTMSAIAASASTTAASASTTAASAYSFRSSANTGSASVTAGPTAGSEDQKAVEANTSEFSAGGTDSAGNPCATLTERKWINDIFGITLAWYNMYTYWCWNGRTVTYHSTWETGGVTGTGSATGWDYAGVTESSFNCYYANGYRCSGNHETSQGKFTACIVKVGCYDSWYPYDQEWELYNGHWSAS